MGACPHQQKPNLILILFGRLQENLLDEVDIENLQLTVALGECWTDESSCKMRYYATIGIMFFISFANHFGRIGSVLLQIRCIDVQDKVIIICYYRLGLGQART